MKPISTHTFSATLQIVSPDWDGVLQIVEASIQLDDSWVPYCQAELTIVTPAEELVEFIDPRENHRVTVVVTQEWTRPVRAPQTRTFDLLLREREVDHETGRTTLKLESDEGYLIDAALVANSADTSRTVFVSSLRALVNDVLFDFEAELQLGDADFDFSGSEDSLTLEPGVTYWDYLAVLVQASGLRLFCDEQRQWWLVEAATYVIDQQINIAASVNLTKGRDMISRYGDWFDSVVVKYSWTSSLGAQEVRYDSAGEPVGNYGIAFPIAFPINFGAPRLVAGKIKVVEWNRPYPGPGAAAAIRARAQGHGRTLALDALSDYTTTPGMTLVATLPDTPIQTGTVSSVAWRFAAEGDSDEMTVGSRGLIDTSETSWLLAPEALTWAMLANGLDWTEYTTP